MIAAALLLVACGASTPSPKTSPGTGGANVNLQCNTCGSGSHPTPTGSMIPVAVPIPTIGCVCQGSPITIGPNGYWPITITNTGTGTLLISQTSTSISGNPGNWFATDYYASWCEPPNTPPYPGKELKPGASCTESWSYLAKDKNPASLTETYYTNGGNVSFTWIGDPN